MLTNVFIVSSFIAMFLFVFKEFYFISNLEVGHNQEVMNLSSIIKAAGITYLFSQLKILLFVEALIFALLYVFIGLEISVAFFMGAILAWCAGFLSMYFSVTYNSKVALAAQKGYDSAFTTAFSVGKIIGVAVSGIAFLSCYVIFLYSSLFDFSNLSVLLIGFSFGASLISVFARIGGGIFTKGADVGADLVGKVEKNIPEDDPRNPAVIADALGDNVGDACGMSADLFQTFVVLVSAAIFLFVQNIKIELLIREIQLIFMILAAGSLASILVLLSGWSFKESDRFSSLGISIKTFFVMSFVLSAISFVLFRGFFEIKEIVAATLCGVFSASLVMPLTEYYTSGGFSPVDGIVESSKQGSANNVIQGLSVGYDAVFFNLLFISLNIFVSYTIHGIPGVAFSCLGMIAVCPVVLALDAFGPITDNAGGLVEMGGLDSSVRDVTDRLDAVGNMTKATTKGYAVFTAGLAAFVLNSLYAKELVRNFSDFDWVLSLENIYILVGLFVGAAVISYFSAFCLLSVNRASITIMEEVRHQFNTLKIMEGLDKPDYNKAIEILTKASLKEMIIPSLLPVISSLGLFGCVGYCSGIESAFLSLSGFIMGVTLVGIVLSISMTVSGGAWDNAKKYIESNGRKHSPEHQAAVIGDTVGDPYKDTAGPAINPVIKLVGIIGILVIMALSR